MNDSVWKPFGVATPAIHTAPVQPPADGALPAALFPAPAGRQTVEVTVALRHWPAGQQPDVHVVLTRQDEEGKEQVIRETTC